MESAERRKTSTDPSEEAGLIAAAQRGDSAAFGMLVRLHQRAIYRLAYGLTRNATNLAFSMFRRRKRRPEVPLEPLVEAGRQFAGGGADPADVAANRQSQR